MKSEREGINTLVKPSGTGCAECLNTGGWWLHFFADAPNVVTSAAVILHQVNTRRSTTRPQDTRLSRASSRESGGFTITAPAIFLPVQIFQLLIRIQ